MRVHRLADDIPCFQCASRLTTLVGLTATLDPFATQVAGEQRVTSRASDQPGPIRVGLLGSIDRKVVRFTTVAAGVEGGSEGGSGFDGGGEGGGEGGCMGGGAGGGGDGGETT